MGVLALWLVITGNKRVPWNGCSFKMSGKLEVDLPDAALYSDGDDLLEPAADA